MAQLQLNLQVMSILQSNPGHRSCDVSPGIKTNPSLLISPLISLPETPTPLHNGDAEGEAD